MRLLLTVILVLGWQCASATDLAERYLDAYFAQFPTRATAAGEYRFDDRLDDLSAAKRQAWIAVQRGYRERVLAALAAAPKDSERIDLELLLREIDSALFEWTVLDQTRPHRRAHGACNREAGRALCGARCHRQCRFSPGRALHETLSTRHCNRNAAG